MILTSHSLSNTILFSILFFIIGSCVGSFLNVIACRYSPNTNQSTFILSITLSRSQCPRCHNLLPYWQLVPILSYLLLKRRCYYCHHPIDSRYLIIELLCGTLFVFVASQTALSLWLLLQLLLTCWFIILALIDIDHYILPDKLTLSLLWFGLIVSYVNNSSYPLNNTLTVLSFEEAFLGVLIGFILLWLPAKIFYLFKGYTELGGGDIKLLSALGAWIPYSKLPLLLCFSSLSGILYFLYHHYYHNKPLKYIAFGPFLLASGWIIIIWQ